MLFSKIKFYMLFIYSLLYRLKTNIVAQTEMVIGLLILLFLNYKPTISKIPRPQYFWKLLLILWIKPFGIIAHWCIFLWAYMLSCTEVYVNDLNMSCLINVQKQKFLVITLYYLKWSLKIRVRRLLYLICNFFPAGMYMLCFNQNIL